MDQSTMDQVKGAIESLLFVNEKPVTLQQLKEVLNEVETIDLRAILDGIIKDNQDTKNGMMKSFCPLGTLILLITP